MIKPELIKAGDILYDCHNTKQGNTSVRRMGTWEVRVLEVFPNGSASVSWNSNAPRVYSPRQLSRLRRTPFKEKSRI